jgi:hypothetical protein
MPVTIGDGLLFFDGGEEGFERREENNPGDCFPNGDRRFFQSITKSNPKCFEKIKNESLSLRQMPASL